jgi:murein DD-endopeptidase MepM/ murein hydrolase activator NlpD
VLRQLRFCSPSGALPQRSWRYPRQLAALVTLATCFLVLTVLASSARAAALSWPVVGPLTSSFADARPGGRTHAGIDVAAAYGTPVRAAGCGIVTTKGFVGGYGNLVAVRHFGGLATYYAHLSAYRTSVGLAVCRSILGYIGSTGRSTGPHLHFEVRRNGVPRNPLLYLP